MRLFKRGSIYWFELVLVVNGSNGARRAATSERPGRSPPPFMRH